MAKKQRTTFAKMQKERARQAKQAEKRERRQSKGEDEQFGEDGEPVFSEDMLGYYPDDIRPGQEAPEGAASGEDAPAPAPDDAAVKTDASTAEPPDADDSATSTPTANTPTANTPADGAE
jgi:hypothetical protein